MKPVNRARPSARGQPRNARAEAPEADTAIGRQNPEPNADEDIIRTAEQFINTINRYGTERRGAQTCSRGRPGASGNRAFRNRNLADRGRGRPHSAANPIPSLGVRLPSSHHVGCPLEPRARRLADSRRGHPDPGPDVRGSSIGPQAAIGVRGGTRLDLTHCTITVASRPSSSAAVVVQPAGAEAGTDKSPAVINITDSFVRSAGNCLTAASGRLLDLQLKNVLVSTEGSMLHALGSSRIEASGPALKATIDRALICSRGGLVHLQSSLEETELPLTLIDAANSVFSTAGLNPLLRVDGQEQADRRHDPIVYKADKVAYDQITTYRRDQILQTGVSPRDYSRSDWRTAFDPKDESPVTEGVKFRKKLGPGRPAWSLTKDDLALDPQSAAGDRGPNMSQIPAPPPPDF